MNILKNLQQKILCSGETATPSTAFRATVERTASPPIALPYQLSVGRWHTDCRAPLNIVCIPNLLSSGVLSFGALTQTALQLPSFGITPNVPLFLHTLDLRSHHTGWCPQEASTPNPLTRPLPSSCKLSKSDESESPNGTVPRGEAKHPLPFDHMTMIADVANFLQGQTSTWAPNAFQGGAVLMGLGFGARAALTLAHAYPHLVQGVVAIAPHPLNSGEGAFPPLVAELRRAGEHLLDPRSWCGATRSSGGDATTAMSQAFQSLRPDHQAAIRSLLEAAPLQQDAAEAYECWAQSMTSLIHFAQTEATLSAVNFYQWLRLLHTQETGGIEACSVPVVLVEDDHGTTTSDGTGGEQVCLLEAELFRTIHRVKCSGLGDGCRTLCVSRDHAKNILTSSLSHLGLLSEDSGMS